MVIDDKNLIERLINSFTKQYSWYKDLGAIGQKILSRLVLTRGDITGIMPFFEKKKTILKDIDDERIMMSDNIQLWQQRKALIGDNPEVKKLTAVFENMEKAIKDFLDAEDQLRRYLEKEMKKGSGQTVSSNVEEKAT